MNYIALLFSFLFLANTTNGQYTFLHEVKTTDSIENTIDINEICYDIFEGTLCRVMPITLAGKQTDTKTLEISYYGLETGHIFGRDTITSIPNYFKPTDVAFNNEFVIITAHKKYIYFNRKGDMQMRILIGTGNILNDKKKPIAFVNCDFIDDSNVLLSNIYNYGVGSSCSGMNLVLLNLKNNTVTKSVCFEFPGIGISPINHCWIAVLNHTIYAVTPLSGLIYTINTDLKIVQTRQLDLFENNIRHKNLEYEAYIDDYSNDGIASNIYGKNTITTMLDSVYSTYSYVEKIFAIDDSTLGLNIIKPKQLYTSRDVAFIDIRSFKIKHFFYDWRISPPDKIERFEDLFCLDISCNRKFDAVFNGKHAYRCNIIPTSIYSLGSKDAIINKGFEYIKQNGYVWSILKYQLDK